MSLKRKHDCERAESPSTSCAEDGLFRINHVKSEPYSDGHGLIAHERKYNASSVAPDSRTRLLRADHSTSPLSLSAGSPTSESQTVSSRKRRKTAPQSKTARPTAPSSTNVPMILNLIDSLVDEKQLNSDNDENFLLTIDCLINSLKHLREKIKTIPHDDTHPLNLSKPKIRPPTCLSSNNTNERNSPTPTTATSPASSFPLPPSLFASQPFFSPFSGNVVSRPIESSHVLSFDTVASMTHLQNYLKLSAASVLNESMVSIDVTSSLSSLAHPFRIQETETTTMRRVHRPSSPVNTPTFSQRTVRVPSI